MLAWDARLARNAAALTLAAAMVALLVVVCTDEGASAARRIAIGSALLPAMGALGAGSAVALARTRGELRALAALGVPPARAGRGAAVGGALVALAGALAVATGCADLGALFPHVEGARAWSFEGTTAAVEASFGLRLDAVGVLTLLPAPGAAREVVAGTFAALPVALALAVAALVFPSWAAQSGSSLRASVVGASVALLSIACFHVVVAGLAPGALLLIGPVVLLLDARLAG